jgi:hypothetical protein
MAFHRISITPGVNKKVTPGETDYFVQKPDSLRLHGLNRNQKRGNAFGTIHQSQTARQCLIDGRYDYSVQQHGGLNYDTADLPFANWPTQLQNELVNRLKKRLHDAGIFEALKGIAEDGTNMCVSLVTPILSRAFH